MEKLCKQKGQDFNKADMEALENGDASVEIERLLDLSDVKKAKKSVKPSNNSNGFNGQRLGMCIKLVADKLSVLPSSEDAWNSFNADVTEFYNRVSEIEAGINNSGDN